MWQQLNVTLKPTLKVETYIETYKKVYFKTALKHIIKSISKLHWNLCLSVCFILPLNLYLSLYGNLKWGLANAPFCIQTNCFDSSEFKRETYGQTRRPQRQIKSRIKVQKEVVLLKFVSASRRERGIEEIRFKFYQSLI